MLDNIFITLYIVGFIAFILAIEKRNITYAGASLVLYLILYAQSIYIEVPWIVATSTTDYATGTQQHLDPAVGASCWLFIIINILMLLYHFLGFWRRRRGEEPAMP